MGLGNRRVFTEGSEDADRIFNVVATGGTDKVNRRFYTHHAHPLITTAVIKIW